MTLPSFPVLEYVTTRNPVLRGLLRDGLKEAEVVLREQRLDLARKIVNAMNGKG